MRAASSKRVLKMPAWLQRLKWAMKRGFRRGFNKGSGKD